jgi:hypothetical protein
LNYVLVMVVVFASAGGVATDTKTVEFDNRDACEVARIGIEDGILELKGTLGRQVFAACYAKQ